MCVCVADVPDFIPRACARGKIISLSVRCCCCRRRRHENSPIWTFGHLVMGTKLLKMAKNGLAWPGIETAVTSTIATIIVFLGGCHAYQPHPQLTVSPCAKLPYSRPTSVRAMCSGERFFSMRPPSKCNILVATTYIPSMPNRLLYASCNPKVTFPYAHTQPAVWLKHCLPGSRL